MDRSRRVGGRRQGFTFGHGNNWSATSPKSDSASLPLPGPQSPVSPTMTHALTTNNTPQQAAPFQGRRSNSNTSMHDFTFSSPLTGSKPLSRKRSRTLDDSYDTPAPEDENDDDDNRKGGHSLRKRVRVNYASELIDDEVVVPNSTSSISRARQRRSEGSEDAQEFINMGSKRRATTDLSDSPSARRRNPSRKTSDVKAYAKYFNDDDFESSQEFTDGLNNNTADNQSQADIGASDFAAGRPDGSPSLKRIKTSQEPETHVPYATGLNSDRGNNESCNTPNSYGVASNDASYEYQDFTDDPNYQLQEENYESSKAAQSRDTSQGQEIPVDPLLAASMAAQSATSRASSEAMQKALSTSKEASSDTKATKSGNVPDNQTTASKDDQPALTDGSSADTSMEQPEAMNENEQRPVKQSSEPEPNLSPIPPTPAEDTTVDERPVQSIEDQEDTPNEITAFPRNAPLPSRPTAPRITSLKKSQPAPQGRYSSLTPYLDGENTYYPEHLVRAAEEEAASEDQTPAEKESEKESGDGEFVADDNADTVAGTEDPTPALNTPVPGSPVLDSMGPTTFNSPVAADDDTEDVEAPERPESPAGHVRYKFRKIREEEEYLSLLDNYDKLTTDELYEVCQAINVNLVAWEEEYARCGKLVDDFENAERRRVADAKYEAKTADLNVEGVNFEEPEFQMKGYKLRSAERLTDTRFLQSQDRLMAQFYGFEYDPHPSKIAKQNPVVQRGEGKETRSRSLRNQPKQTAKATEADEVTGKRQRKPVQLFEPSVEPASRGSTPVPTRSRRGRRAANAEVEPVQPPSFTQSEANNDTTTQGRPQRKRGPRAKHNVPSNHEDWASTQDGMTSSQEDPKPVGRRGRTRAAPPPPVEDEPREEQPPRKRHILTLKIPKGKDLSQPSSTISDNGESRPSTASSESTSQTLESNYSFRPNRQKRFRDEPDALNGDVQERPRKKNKHAEANGENGDVVMSITPTTESGMLGFTQGLGQANGERKPTKIRISKQAVAPPQDSRNGTPTSQPSLEDGEKPKDYSAMTKSEKMSASMKSKFLMLPSLPSLLTRNRSLGKRKHGWRC